jgi:hypothetical protein
MSVIFCCDNCKKREPGLYFKEFERVVKPARWRQISLPAAQLHACSPRCFEKIYEVWKLNTKEVEGGDDGTRVPGVQGTLDGQHSAPQVPEVRLRENLELADGQEVSMDESYDYDGREPE